jgi:SSS family solute:Na+ symporter
MSTTAAICSVMTGFLVSTFWLVFINGKTAAGIGWCKALFGTPTLVGGNWSPTWAVVDPLFIGLPLSALVAILITYLGKPMDPEYAKYCFGGPPPKGK